MLSSKINWHPTACINLQHFDRLSDRASDPLSIMDSVVFKNQSALSVFASWNLIFIRQKEEHEMRNMKSVNTAWFVCYT